jgi:hypothetical protein
LTAHGRCIVLVHGWVRGGSMDRSTLPVGGLLVPGWHAEIDIVAVRR